MTQLFNEGKTGLLNIDSGKFYLEKIKVVPYLIWYIGFSKLIKCPNLRPKIVKFLEEMRKITSLDSAVVYWTLKTWTVKGNDHWALTEQSKVAVHERTHPPRWRGNPEHPVKTHPRPWLEGASVESQEEPVSPQTALLPVASRGYCMQIRKAMKRKTAHKPLHRLVRGSVGKRLLWGMKRWVLSPRNHIELQAQVTPLTQSQGREQRRHGLLASPTN